MLRSILQEKRQHLTSNTHSNSSNSSESNSTASTHSSEHLEPWHEWIERSTRRIEEYTGKLGIEDWVHLARKRIYNWAGHISRRYDERWGSLLLDGMPNRGIRFQESGLGRKHARPKFHWEDCVIEYFAAATDDMHWRLMAADKSTWDRHLRAFSIFKD